MTARSPRLTAALAYAAAGIPVFPCLPGSKSPATTRGFKDATTDVDQIESWWQEADYNLAVEPEQAGWAVVDLDGSEGIAEWVAFPEHPQTFTVTTPRGGRHLYFHGSLPSSVKEIAPHIDTRGRGGYVLLPPSEFNGLPYYQSNKLDIADLPEWVEPALKARKRATPVTAAAENIDREAALQRAREWLTSEARRGEVPDGTRNNEGFKVATALRDLGCDEQTRFDLMTELWQPRLSPPLDDDELRQIIDSASRNSQNAEGAYALRPADEAFKDFLDANPAPKQPGLPDPVLLGDLDGEEKPVEFIIRGWIQKHRLNIFRGRGGSNKSRLSLQWSMMVDAGQNAAGFMVDKATAIYISCEDDEDEVKRRRNAIAKKLGLPKSGVVYFDMTDEDDAFLMYVSDDGGVTKTAKWADLEARMLALPGHKLLVFDSTYDVIDFAGSTRNSDGHVRQVIRAFDRLCRGADCTIICLWHPSRAGMSRGDEGGFATAWDNTPRNCISIKESEDENYVLTAEKRNNAAAGEPAVLRWSEGVLQVISGDDAAEIMLHEVIVEQAIAAAKSGQPIQAKRKPPTWLYDELFKALGHKVSTDAIRAHLTKECMKEDGRLEYHDYDKHGRNGPAGWHARKNGTPEGAPSMW